MKRFALLMMLAGCMGQEPVEAPAPGVPDPFALTCAKQGGVLDSAPVGLRTCRLPDGEVLTESG
jgi:putative hemolysin